MASWPGCAVDDQEKPKGQFVGLAAIMLFDRLLRRLEARGVLPAEDRKTIIDEAMADLRGVGMPLSDRAAEMIETSFKVPRPPSPPVPPRQD